MAEERLPKPPADLAKPPPGWGQDALTAFLDFARRQEFAVFHSLRPQYTRVSEIEQAFQSFLDQNPPDPLSSLMLLRSHAAYLAAARLA